MIVMTMDSDNPTSMGMEVSQPGMVDVGFSLEFHDFRVDADLFPPGHFQHGSTDGRTLFPLDTFVSISLGSMEGMMEEEDDDIPF